MSRVVGVLTGAATAELGAGFDIEALPAWLLHAAVQYLAVCPHSLTPIRPRSTAVHMPEEGHAVQDALAVQGPKDCGEHLQASTDTEPRSGRGRQARQARPRTPVGQQDDKFDFNKFIKGDLPGKLGMMLVSLSANVSPTILL